MLSTIALTVNGQELTANSTTVASNLIEEITCSFTFSGTDWDEFDSIYAIFQNKQNGITIEKLLSNDQCTVPPEVLARKGEIVVNLCAYAIDTTTQAKSLQMTSYKTKIIDVLQKVNVDGSNSNPPTAEVWEQELNTEITARQNADTSLGNRITTIEGKEATWDAKVSEAPQDGKQYARKDGGWDEVQSTVQSVNGKTGVVVLDADDVGALAEDDVIDNVTSTSAVDPLSANQGKLLNDRINNLESIGRYLAIWNCTTGLPTTNPSSLPYVYKTGDYYRIGAVNSGNTTHDISISGTSSGGIYDGTYSVSFELENSTATAYTTIADIADAIGLDTFIEATGTMHTTTEGDLNIVSVIKWVDNSGNSIIALVGDDGQKIGMTSTTSDTLTDTVSGGGVNYKPNGSTYTGVTSSTVAVETEIASGDLWVFDGTNWNLSINHIGAFVEDVKVNGTSVVSGGEANVTVPTALSDLTDDTAHRVVTDTQINTWNSKSAVSVSETGTATDEVQYITINGTEKKLAGGSGSSDVFIATYGTTTASEVAAARSAGKAVFLRYAPSSAVSHQLMLVDESDSKYVFAENTITTEDGVSAFDGVAIALNKSTSEYQVVTAGGTLQPGLDLSIVNGKLCVTYEEA